MKLTMPAYDHGACRVMVDGRQVGHVLGEFYGWRAYLWRVPDVWPPPADAEQVYRRGRLADLRAQLRERLETEGPWWTEEEGDE